MRLWHEDLLPFLPTLQFNGQHRECCALRGAGWGKKHTTVDYVFRHPRVFLAEYHNRYLRMRLNRGYTFDLNWCIYNYRGKNCESDNLMLHECIFIRRIVYPEHNEDYLIECLNNLFQKMFSEPKKYTKEDFIRIQPLFQKYKIKFRE